MKEMPEVAPGTGGIVCPKKGGTEKEDKREESTGGSEACYPIYVNICVMSNK